MFIGRFGVSQTSAQHFGGFFHQSVPANTKKGCCTSRLPNNEEIGVIFVLAYQNFNSFQKLKIKV
jgi:hypothetical protein